MSDPTTRNEYVTVVADFRRQKDVFFQSDPHSPLPASQRANFSGLAYFPADFAWRIEAKVERLPGGEIFTMQTTDGATRDFERYAKLTFAAAGTACTLAGFRSADEDAMLDGEMADHVSLFVPFRDALSGKATYPAGRYMDVEVEQDEDGNPVVILDFNLAYNPYCAYNDLYSCPITPFENTLPIAVPAGEQLAAH